MQRWKLEGAGVEVFCVHKQLLLALRVLTVRRMLPLGDWLEREDTSMRGSMKTLFQWFQRVPEGLNLDRKRKKWKQEGHCPG